MITMIEWELHDTTKNLIQHEICQWINENLNIEYLFDN